MFLSGRSTGWVSRFSSTDEWIFLADQSAEETDGELKAKRTASRGAPKTRKKKRRHQTKKKRTNEGDAGARARATRLSLNFPEQKKKQKNDVQRCRRKGRGAVRHVARPRAVGADGGRIDRRRPSPSSVAMNRS